MKFKSLTSMILLAAISLVGCDSSTPIANQTPSNPTTNGDVSRTSVSSDEKTPVAIVAAESTPELEEEAKAKFEALQAQLKADVAALQTKLEATESPEEQGRLFSELNPAPEFANNMMAMAEKYQNTKMGVKAALAALARLDGDARDPAMTLLITKFPTKVSFSKICKPYLDEMPKPLHESWMKLMVEHAKDDQTKASVAMVLAEYVNRIGRYQVALDDNPQLIAKLPKSQTDYIFAERSEASYQELGDLMEWVSQFDPNRYGRKAGSLKTELTSLRIGQMAPEIEGEDLDGIPFRLSDYRGKVVMLDFWGHWCPPCRRMYPHEQYLTSELRDTPFVLLGVNSDRDLDTAKGAVEDEGLTWRHFWNGPKGTDGPIAEAWNVEGWPTIYLIGADGRIKAKHIAYENLERAIENSLAEVDVRVSLDGVH